MTILKKVKENLFALLVVSTYAVMLAIKPVMGMASLKNSLYFVREMILIMPVIFILTALLDMWVPKEKILKYLGKDAQIKGIILSFVLGSISAGPIYAAFPLCVMLHRKGASVRNLVIILSAWAVIKVPMLLNEMKFLGFQFMAFRWILTIIAIIAFSWITALLVKDKDFPQAEREPAPLSINAAACMGCTLCTENYPELFSLHGNKASVQTLAGATDQVRLKEAFDACPVNAIVWDQGL
jgi:uncharacterized membrane protein YraQ (UPF0718 family)